MKFLTIIEGKLKEMVEKENVIGDEHNIVGLTHSSNMDIMVVETKTRFLCRVKLLIVISTIKIAARHSPLLNSLFIKYWTHYLPIPFTESLPVFQSIVKVNEPGAVSAKKEQVSDHNFSYSFIISRPRVQKQTEDWFIVYVNIVLNNLC